MSERTVSVDLSSPQQSILGKALGRLYYETNLLDLLDSSKVIRTGFPHNGGYHTLRISGPAEEVIDFLRILKSEFPSAASEIYKLHKALLNADRVAYMKLEGKNLEEVFV